MSCLSISEIWRGCSLALTAFEKQEEKRSSCTTSFHILNVAAGVFYVFLPSTLLLWVEIFQICSEGLKKNTETASIK